MQVLFCLALLPAQASSIFLAGDSNIFVTTADNEVFFENVFGGMSVVNYSSRNLNSLGVTATETNYGLSTAITSGNLAGNDFMVFGYTRTSVSGSELSAITDYYNNGGSLFLFGEGNPGFTSLNNTVNSILNAVGSTMRLSTTNNFDAGSSTTLTGLVGNGPYADGVNSWTTAYASEILLGSGEAIISGTADLSFGTAVGFEGSNGLPPSPIPVPAAVWLFGSALAGFAGFSRYKKKA